MPNETVKFGNSEGGSTVNTGIDGERYLSALLGARRVRGKFEPCDLFLGRDEGYTTPIGIEVKSGLNKRNKSFRNRHLPASANIFVKPSQLLTDQDEFTMKFPSGRILYAIIERLYPTGAVGKSKVPEIRWGDIFLVPLDYVKFLVFSGLQNNQYSGFYGETSGNVEARIRKDGEYRWVRHICISKFRALFNGRADQTLNDLDGRVTRHWSYSIVEGPGSTRIYVCGSCAYGKALNQMAATIKANKPKVEAMARARLRRKNEIARAVSEDTLTGELEKLVNWGANEVRNIEEALDTNVPF